MRRFLVSLSALLFLLISSAVAQSKGVSDSKAPYQASFVVVTDFVTPGTGADLSDALQKIIDEHPNRTIYFPDGEYLLSKSLLTPAEPSKSVHIVMGNYAILKAMDSWQKDGGALIRLGGKLPFNNIRMMGSNYGLEGGIMDGSGIADGVSIDSGRETRVRNVSIKNVRIGIHVKYGANSGSSDSDIMDVNIVGNDTPESIGVLLEGYDNTLSNMRIYAVHTGVWVKSGGNSLRNIHPLYAFNEKQVFDTSTGFIVEQGNNFLNYCYSDQFATGFSLNKGVCANLTDCFVWWYRGDVAFQTALDCHGPLESFVTGLHVGFSDNCQNVTLLKAEAGGKGCLEHVSVGERIFTKDDASRLYRM